MSESSKSVPIPGSHRAPLAQARVVGPSDPTREIEVTLVLRSGDARGRSIALRRVGAPGTRGPSHLSRAQFATRYGANDSDLQRVQEFAQRAGLVVHETDPARRTVVLAGQVAQMNAAFGVEMQDYQLPDGSSYRGRTGTVNVPAELADVVEAVLGLDDRPQARPHYQLLEDLVPEHVRPLRGAAATQFTPVQIAGLYNFPRQINQGQLDGHGECVAIIELGGGFVQADLDAYFTGLGIQPPEVVAVGVDGAGNQPGDDADVEVMLDIEVAGAVAPGAKIAVYFAPNTSRGFYDAITTAVHDQENQPSVISISWGAPEGRPNWTTSAMQAYSRAFQDAALLGVTVCAASGDNGSSDGASDGRPHVDFPAASPYALACGGTKLVANGDQIASEVVWNEAPDSATGGGVSLVFARPSWQAQAQVPPRPSRRGSGRGVPDVAGDADPVTGYKIRVNGKDTVVGGTSAVAPLWAGLIALYNQCLNRHLGHLNPQIYGAALPQAFHDITSGNNGDYPARSGWDACTGLGSPDGTAILQALQGA